MFDKGYFKYRTILYIVAPILIILVMVAADPDVGWIRNLGFAPSTLSWLIMMFTTLLFVGLLHIGVRGSFDYIHFEKLLRETYEKKDPIANALIFIGTALYALAVSGAFIAAAMFFM